VEMEDGKCKTEDVQEWSEMSYFIPLVEMEDGKCKTEDVQELSEKSYFIPPC
jgi:endogenous inhibitor of DNA gyrase (YacG/DUF329 family)